MIDLTKIRKMYFIGIGGIGMSALARYFNSGGVAVSGYDRTSTSLTDELIKEGMKIHFEDNINLLPSELRTPNSELLIVYTPAVPSSHRELKYFRENNFNLIKRAELLGMLTKNHTTIAVAGTHGKTTTSSLVAHIFKYAGKNCSAFLGGIAKNFNSNLVVAEGKDKSGQVMIVEADEYDRSFLQLHPDIAVVTSIDPDHLDIYGSNEKMRESYSQFVEQVKPQGIFIGRKNLGLKSSSRSINYSANETADYYASDIRIANHENVFDIKWNGGEVKDVSSQMPGRHNVENTVAAFACAHLSGIEAEVIKEAIKKFEGVVRRFDYRFKSEKTVYIDDYAHHPEELRACIQSVRELYPGKKITGIFQPHLFSRTRDFADGFSKSLSLLDRLILLDIYPAREEPIPGVTSELIFKNVSIKDKVMMKKEDVIPMLEKSGAEVLLTLGAGDIDTLVKPIAEMLKNKIEH
jgi:UDP-N-acetylmuramate--alanine ligase